jgi:hypothetical protein
MQEYAAACPDTLPGPASSNNNSMPNSKGLKSRLVNIFAGIRAGS